MQSMSLLGSKSGIRTIPLGGFCLTGAGREFGLYDQPLSRRAPAEIFFAALEWMPRDGF